MAYTTLTGKLLEERDDAIRMLVFPNWDLWLPRATINPRGGLRIKRATGEVSADVVGWKIEKLVSDGCLPPSMRGAAKSAAIADVLREFREHGGLEAADEHFINNGQEKT